MPDPTPPPAPEPCPNEKEVATTINRESEVDEAALESFPASDPPGVLGQRVGPADLPSPEPDEPADEEEA
jgi:hypothetical protein